MAGGPIPTVAPVDHGDRADVDHHRADARRARRRRLPHRRRRRRCSTCCAGRSTGATPGQSIPPEKFQPIVAVPRAPSSGGHQGRVPAERVHRGPPRGRALPRVPGHVEPGDRGPAPAARRRAVRLRLLRRHRQGGPRVRARPTTTTPSWPTSTGWSATWRAALPPGAALVVTADHGQVDVGDNLVPLDRDVLDHVSFQSGEGRFRWLHARPGAPPALLEAATGAPRHRRLGGDPRGGDRRAAGSGPTVSDAARSRLGDVALVARASGRLRRSRRQRAVRAGLPPRIAHRRPRCWCRCWPCAGDGRGTSRDSDRMGTMSDWQGTRRARSDDRDRPSWSIPTRSTHAGAVDGPPTRRPPRSRTSEFVSEPAKVMRIGSMIKQLLDEVRATPLDEPGRERLAEIYETSIAELGAALSPDLRDELQPAGAAVRRRRGAERRRAARRPRPSSSAGSRASSTASRPPCSPSRWRPASSSSRCAASCRQGAPGPERSRHGQPTSDRQPAGVRRAVGGGP